MQALQVRAAAALALLLCSLAVGQASECTPVGSTKLRFVTQLNINGCALFVHDTGASDGLHLAVEPVMCVTDELEELVPKLDPITRQKYLSIPVVLRDADMLAGARRQLAHLSPKSVSYSTVRSVTTVPDNSANIQALSFVWSPEESKGFLRLLCPEKLTKLFLFKSQGFDFRGFLSDLLREVSLSASIFVDKECLERRYQPRLKNDYLFETNFHAERYSEQPLCQAVKPVRTVSFGNCTARVYPQEDNRTLLVEPLLCHNISSMSSESVRYDYIRDKHYINLDLVMTDDAVLDAVRTQLADLSPRSVEFMRLWRAQSIVSALLGYDNEIGPLMESTDWRSAKLRVYCPNVRFCLKLKLIMASEPVDFWRHVSWSLMSLGRNQCVLKHEGPVHSWRMREAAAASPLFDCDSVCQSFRPGGSREKYLRVLSDGRLFAVIQQRLTGRVNFTRNLTEYENGFGDDTDFWIGLLVINRLTAGGTILRVEGTLWTEENFYTELANFTVRDSRENYALGGLPRLIHDRSNQNADFGLIYQRLPRFATIDRPEPTVRGCAAPDGWWASNCLIFNPNGQYPTKERAGQRDMVLRVGDNYLAIREVRLLVQV